MCQYQVGQSYNIKLQYFYINNLIMNSITKINEFDEKLIQNLYILNYNSSSKIECNHNQGNVD